jgi:excisionase family DNA binding protein
MKRKQKRIPRLLNVDELAEYLGLQKQTIYNWLHTKKISGIKIGKVWRFDRKYIDQWLKACSKG